MSISQKNPDGSSHALPKLTCCPAGIPAIFVAAGVRAVHAAEAALRLLLTSSSARSDVIENLEMRISRTESDQRSLPIPDRNAAGSSSRSRPQTAHHAQRSAKGTKAPVLRSADRFRSTPVNGHLQSPSACLKGAIADFRPSQM